MMQVPAVSPHLEQDIRLCKEYKAWRAKVLARDVCQCQQCGSFDVLEVHHVHRFTEIIVQHGITSLEDAQKCEPLWDVSNGLTLCKPCHQRLKRTRGCLDGKEDYVWIYVPKTMIDYVDYAVANVLGPFIRKYSDRDQFIMIALSRLLDREKIPEVLPK